MARFSFIAEDGSGKKYQGDITANDEAAVHAKIQERGLYILDVKKEERFFQDGRKKISITDIIVFTERFSAMVNAGLSIIRSLNTIFEQTENISFKKVVYNILLDLEGGGTLSGSFSKYPHVFSDYYVSMLKAGETGGILDESLLSISEYLNAQQELKRKIKSAFSYPLIVLGAAAVVVGFLVTFIVPIFSNVYSKMGLLLPIPTVILVNISNFFINYWWAAVLGVIVLIAAYKRMIAFEKGRYLVDSLKLKIPIFGKLMHKVIVSRFIKTFGSLFASGVPITEIIDVVKDVANNKVFTNLLDKMKRDITEGRTIAESLSEGEIFDPMIMQMISAGEEAGVLDEMLLKSAQFIDRDVDYTIGKLGTILEPVLTVLLAFVVGFIALAIYLPMFDLLTEVK